MTVLSSTLSLYILWLIAKKYAVEAKWFILVVSGIFIFHQYGFTTTPDAPLFLFTVLFYYIYQKYVDDDRTKWALLLALIIACLLYSKYHGILLSWVYCFIQRQIIKTMDILADRRAGRCLVYSSYFMAD